MYKPLPNGLTIKQSTVDGLGLFTTKEFKDTTVLGISHVRNEHFEHSILSNWSLIESSNYRS